MPSGKSSTSLRRPWVATAIWGWRLELLLTGGTLIVLAISARVVSFGPLLVAMVVLVALRPGLEPGTLGLKVRERDRRMLIFR
jgi:hypothetical protein